MRARTSTKYPKNKSSYKNVLNNPTSIATINNGNIQRDTLAVVSSLMRLPDFSNSGISMTMAKNKTPKITKTDIHTSLEQT
ncbi:MAG: hypothetical protein ACJAVV_000557 [Alphaproteobacteria bacterium]|jgi:hypothetical protein